MRIGLYNGVFDLLHRGHLYALREARRQCDWLVVAVNTDESVAKLKGPDRPYQPLQVRMWRMWHAGCAHALIPYDGWLENLIVTVKPQVLFKGWDHPIDITKGVNQVASGLGAEIVQLQQLAGYSTTEIARSAAAGVKQAL